MSTETLIEVKNLSRYYGHLCAVDDISFSVHRGQILGFLGPNGAGKTTTMQIIAGNLAPSMGEILVAGYDLLDEPLKAKASVGYLPEQPPLYREMLVEEFLRFCAKLRKIPHATINKAVNRALELCGLTEVRKRLIANLSKGFQQRIGIAQAIIHTPAVVILDEPTVGLDPIQIREIRSLIQDLGKEHSVILSTHILSEVQTLCNHVQIINRGKLILNDTINGLFAQMQTTSLYVGFKRPPSVDILRQIEGVEAVEILDDYYLRIRHLPEKSPAMTLVEKSVGGNWGLFELTPEKRSLEQVFVELTHSEQLSLPNVELEAA